MAEGDALQKEEQADGGDEGVDVGLVVQRAVDEPFHQEADAGQNQHGKENRQPVVEFEDTATRVREMKAPNMYLFPWAKVGDMEDPVDQGQAQGHEGIDRPDEDAVQDLLEEEDHG